LIDKRVLTAEQRQLLDEFMTEQRASGRSSKV
jgi:hypothetical protein